MSQKGVNLSVDLVSDTNWKRIFVANTEKCKNQLKSGKLYLSNVEIMDIFSKNLPFLHIKSDTQYAHLQNGMSDSIKFPNATDSVCKDSRNPIRFTIEWPSHIFAIFYSHEIITSFEIYRASTSKQLMHITFIYITHFKNGIFYYCRARSITNMSEIIVLIMLSNTKL